MTIELDTTLAQAEVLFLSFQQLIADIDRRRAENDIPSAEDAQRLRKRRARASGSNATASGGDEEAKEESGASTARKATVALPTITSNLRELLEAN